jgi:hypothetical protein
VANPTWYQRYVDFIVLLILFALVASARAPVRSLDVVRWAVVVCLSVAWTVTVALA